MPRKYTHIKQCEDVILRLKEVIIPALSEPLVRNLRATTPESESH